MSHDQASLDLLRHVVDYFMDHGPDTYGPDVYEKLQALQTSLKVEKLDVTRDPKGYDLYGPDRFIDVFDTRHSGPVVNDGYVYDDIPDRDDEDWGIYWVDRLGHGWVDQDGPNGSIRTAFMTRQAAEAEADRHRDRTDVAVRAVPATVDVVQLGLELRVELADRAVSEARRALDEQVRLATKARSRLHRP